MIDSTREPAISAMVRGRWKYRWFTTPSMAASSSSTASNSNEDMTFLWVSFGLLFGTRCMDRVCPPNWDFR